MKELSKSENLNSIIMKEYEMTDKQKQEVRKAYFAKKLDEYLQKRLAEGAEEEEYAKILEYLEVLKLEADQIKGKFEKYSLDEEFKPPTVQELMRLDEKAKEELENWEIKKMEDYARAKKIVETANIAAREGRSRPNDWIEWGLQLLTAAASLDELVTWRKQLYNAQITKFVEMYDSSMSEATSRAILTPEFREYENINKFVERLNSMEMEFKKMAAIISGY